MDDIFESRWFPWVAGLGGAVLVYLIFFGGKGSSSQTVGYDAANLQMVALQAQLGAQTDQARIAAESTDTAALAGMATNLATARYSYDLGAKQVAAGVQTTQISADAARRMELQHEITTRQQIHMALPIAEVQANATIAAVNAQANAQKSIASSQQTSSFFNSILGVLPKLLPLAAAG